VVDRGAIDLYVCPVELAILFDPDGARAVDHHLCNTFERKQRLQADKTIQDSLDGISVLVAIEQWGASTKICRHRARWIERRIQVERPTVTVGL
jgi:hypothetical protein